MKIKCRSNFSNAKFSAVPTCPFVLLLYVEKQELFPRTVSITEGADEEIATREGQERRPWLQPSLKEIPVVEYNHPAK